MIRRFPITGPSIITLVACVLMIAVVMMHLPGLVSAALSPGAGEEDPADVVAQLLGDHEEEFQLYRDRFNGRSLFYKPRPPAPTYVPRPPAPRPEPKPVEKPKAPEPAPPSGPPPNYQGPSINYVVGDDVWFKPTDPEAKELRIRIGETREGVTVINCDKLPYSVRLGYSGGEYDVKIFDPNTLFDDETAQAPAAHPGIEEAPKGRVVPVSNPAPEPPAASADDRAAKAARYAEVKSDRGRSGRKGASRNERDRDDPADQGGKGEIPPSLR